MPMPVPGQPRTNPSEALLLSEHVNVKAYSAAGDGVTDDTAAIQAAIDAASGDGRSGRVYFPNGNYIITSTLNVNTEYGSVRLSGAVGRNADTSPYSVGSGSRILGSINGALIQRTNVPSSNIALVIEDLALWNTHATGICIIFNRTQAPSGVYRCSLFGFRGFQAVTNNFSINVENCWVQKTGNSNGVGIEILGHSLVKNCDVVGYSTGYGIVAQGTGNQILGGRCEVNGTGIYLLNGFQGSVSGIRMEANDVGINATSLFSGATVISGVNIYGTVGSPSGGGITGLNIDEVWGLSIIGVSATGHTNDFKVGSTANRFNLSFISCVGGTWSLPADKHDITIIESEGVTEIVRAPVVATASLPAAGTGENGRLIIEDAGAGDRNLILYAGGQRFRIDGGANV